MKTFPTRAPRASRTLIVLAAVACGGLPLVPWDALAAPSSDAAPGTPRARAMLARAFVQRWAGEARRDFGLAPAAWSSRLVPVFATAPMQRLHAGLAARDFRQAVSRLNGDGRPVTGRALGDPVQDQVYTPLVPCRLVDTRRTFEGALAGEGTRAFVLAGLASYRAQGGADGDCGLRGTGASAVVVNLTSVQPSGAGFATLYPFDGARPLAASVNYPTGDVRGNLVVARLAGPGSVADATLYTLARAHYVMDVVGYYAPPRATALACLRGEAWSEEGTGVVTVQAPTCPDGYTPIATNCSTSPEATLVTAGVDGCQARAPGTARATVTATPVCCRVPGR